MDGSLLFFRDNADYTRNENELPKRNAYDFTRISGIATAIRPAYGFPLRGQAKMRAGSVRFLRFLCSTLVLFFCGVLVAAQSPVQSPAQAPEIPAVDGGLGACQADFTVKDDSAKPIYNAKIHTTIKYGFFSKRKTELEVGTNSDGKARVTGLPNLPKKPLEFSIKSGTVSTTVTDDPSNNCKAVFDVTLSVH